MTSHMFGGASTPEGFVSFYGEILPAEQIQKMIILKGSSGSGKSTYLKKLGRIFEEKNLPVEYYHCSNDVNSLDAVCAPSLGLCAVDGTAPHTLDPVIPMAEDEIFNVGEFINEEAARAHRGELASLMREKNELQKRAANYLLAASAVSRNNALLCGRELDRTGLNRKITELLSELPGTSSGGPGRNRRHFASALTPDGPKTFTDTLFDLPQFSKIYILRARDGMGADLLLAELQSAANRLGYNTESFYCPMKPSKTEHLTIPALGLGYTTVNQYHPAPRLGTMGKEIDFAEFCVPPAGRAEEITCNDDLFQTLIAKYSETALASRSFHDQIEAVYIAAMDFAGLDAACERTTASMMRAAGLEG